MRYQVVISERWMYMGFVVASSGLNFVKIAFFPWMASYIGIGTFSTLGMY